MACGIFLVFLAYFVGTGGWFPPARLEVNGTAPGGNGKLEIDWDSGSGFNDYEKRQFALDTSPDSGVSTIRIAFTGQKNPASRGKNIVLLRITADGRPVRFRDAVKGGFKINRRGFLVLSRPGNHFIIDVFARRHIRVTLASNRFAGKALIRAFGRSKVVDLFSGNREIKHLAMDYWLTAADGSFTISMEMPRYPVKKTVVRRVDLSRPLFIKSISLITRSGMKPRTMQAPPASDRVEFENINQGLKTHLDPLRLPWQIAFAAVSTWMVTVLRRRMHTCGGLKAVFVGERRYIFWALFFGMALVFGFWLAAFWPGVMSIDSLKIWRAARLPDVSIQDHPVINVVLYMFLMQLWNHTAVVPLAQILLTALLSAWIFFSLYRRGLSLPVLILFYLPLALSIPAGLYSVTLWKDIPFALLVVFWAFALGEILRRRNNEMQRFSLESLLAYGLLFVALVFTRFNGLVYLAVVPVLLIFMGLVSFRKLMVMGAVCGVALAVVVALKPGNAALANLDYVSQQSRRLLRHLGEQPIQYQLKQFADNYFRIFDVNQKISRWDLWHLFLRDRYAYRFLQRSGWWDVFPYQDPKNRPFPRLYETGLNLYKWSNEKPQVYFSWNPFYMLAFFPLAILAWGYLPRSAIFAAVVMVQLVTMLFVLKIMNWRYYYFAYLGCFYLVPLMVVECMQKRRFSERGYSKA